MKIAVYAIAKNEGKHVDQFMDSVKDADIVVVADTGSTDDTVERLRDRGAIVYPITVTPWRFDYARNLSLNRVPDDVDVCIKLDLDEVMNPGWRTAIEAAWTPTTTWLMPWYYLGPTQRCRCGWIHTRHNYRWKYAVHETLVHSGVEVITESGDDLSIAHYPDREKCRGNYLTMLEQAAADEPCAHTSYYLGREYFRVQDFHKCIHTLVPALNDPEMPAEARMVMMTFIADSFFYLDDLCQCFGWHQEAIKAYPAAREPRIMLAIAFFEQGGDERETLKMLDEALKCTTPCTHFHYRPQAWDATPYEVASHCATAIGDFARAAEYTNQMQALGLEPLGVLG